MEEKTCSSCKKKVVNDPGSVTLACPGCSQYQIVRCSSCRRNATRYKCASCGFEGPN